MQRELFSVQNNYKFSGVKYHRIPRREVHAPFLAGLERCVTGEVFNTNQCYEAPRGRTRMRDRGQLTLAVCPVLYDYQSKLSPFPQPTNGDISIVR